MPPEAARSRQCAWSNTQPRTPLAGASARPQNPRDSELGPPFRSRRSGSFDTREGEPPRLTLQRRTRRLPQRGAPYGALRLPSADLGSKLLVVVAPRQLPLLLELESADERTQAVCVLRVETPRREAQLGHHPDAQRERELD